MAEQGRNTSTMAMGTNEIVMYKLRPHPVAFIRYYSVGVLLLIWTGILFYLEYQGWLEFEWFESEVNALMPTLFLLLGMVLIGRFLVGGYRRAFSVLFWVAVIGLIVVSVLYIWLWDDADFAVTFALLFGLAIGLLGVLTAEVYRRAFSYIVTNQRVVLRYKLLAVEETTLRYEKIEDFTIERSLAMRVFGLGTIRAWTGTEDAKYDSNRAFNDPHEAVYGIRKPYEVKGKLVELILERDERDKQMIELLQDRQAGVAPREEGPEPAPHTVPQATESNVTYYQPAPAPEPQPAPVRNYERIDPSAYVQPDDEIPLPVPDEVDDADAPRPSPVRKMYPEAKESSSEFQLEGGGDMDFHRGPAGDGDKSSRDGTRRRRYDGEDDDLSKPRAL